MRITRRTEFAASHRLRRADWDDARNREVFGREGEREHGHNYVLEVTVQGAVDPVTGMVMDLTELKEVIAREVEDRFDHRNLNLDTPYFEKQAPTPENLARVIFDLLDPALPGRRLECVRLWPNADVVVEVGR